jgi:hypothetical protein
LEEYKTVHTIQFIAESFKKECAKTARNIKNWEQIIKVAKELDDYDINEIWQSGVLRALRLTCVISGERVEVIGLCTP